MNPFFLPLVLLGLSVVFFIAENIKERPSIGAAAVYILAAMESVYYMAVVL